MDEVKRNYERQLQDPLLKKFTDSGHNLIVDRVKEFMTLGDMREITKLLIHAGADANASHKTGINGFTPLMLAAELDEVELFEAMVQKNGDPLITAEHPGTGNPIDSKYVAFAHQSNKVLRYLASQQKRA